VNSQLSTVNFSYQSYTDEVSAFRRLIASLACAAALAGAACGDPPDREMQQAQNAIEAARTAGADHYAPAEFAAAEDALKRAREAVAQRDYRLALNNALDARERAQNASKETADKKAAARTDAERELLDALAALNDANARLRTRETARPAAKAFAALTRVIAESDVALQKARAAFDRGDYPAVVDLARPTTQHLRDATHDLEAASTAPGRRRP
jgi:hypothetical protein